MKNLNEIDSTSYYIGMIETIMLLEKSNVNSIEKNMEDLMQTGILGLLKENDISKVKELVLELIEQNALGFEELPEELKWRFSGCMS